MKLVATLSAILFLACLPGCGSDTTNANDDGTPDATVTPDANDATVTNDESAGDAPLTDPDAALADDAPLSGDATIAADAPLDPAADPAVTTQDDGTSDPDATSDAPADTPVADAPAPDAPPAGLAIAGTWEDEWGGSHVITDTTWTMAGMAPGLFAITQYDNAVEFLIAHNDASNAYSPDLWSRFDWATYQGALYYCQTAYDKATEADALATEAADRMDPTSTGCGGSFPWSKLVQK